MSTSTQDLVAEIRRQAILDYLNANPGSRMAAIQRHVLGQMDYAASKSANNTLRTMICWGEARCEGSSFHVRYWATATTTRPASEACERRRAATVAKTATLREQQAERSRETEPWRYIHKPDTNPAIRNQGGQGCLRPRVYIQAGAIDVY